VPIERHGEEGGFVGERAVERLAVDIENTSRPAEGADGDNPPNCSRSAECRVSFAKEWGLGGDKLGRSRSIQPSPKEAREQSR
jgi:hypothetical protein